MSLIERQDNLATEKLIKELENKLREATEDLNAIFEISKEIIVITDSNGTILRVSSSCQYIWGYSQTEIIGKNVYELEEEGVFQPSVAKMVIESKQMVTQLQTTLTGRRLLVTGTPVFNSEGELVRVVNTSKDITDETKLREDIKAYRREIERYEKELNSLKNQYSDFSPRSKAMQNIKDLALTIAEVPSTVLITGETGVGKSFLAKFIHEHSDRANQPFVTINCGSIPENLLESELFGYMPGSFTGASKEGKKGLVEIADKGILFLDEISEIPLRLQVKLLQLIQEKTYFPVGSVECKKADIRIIAATNQNLLKMVQEKTFREDLYYRLSVIPIHIPPLRDRREDIIPLARSFISKYNQLYKRNRELSPEIYELLTSYDWPGNIRELENLIERIVVTTKHEFVELEDLPHYITRIFCESNETDRNSQLTLKEALEKTEVDMLKKALSKCRTTVEAAKMLGIDQSTVSRKMKKYGITRKDFK